MVANFFTEQSLPVVASTSVVLAVAFFLAFTSNSRKKNNATSLPVSPTGIWENVVGLGGSDAPFWVLALSRKLNTMNFMMRVPGMSVYIIGDYKLVREILKDSTSDKPRMVYKAFEGTGSKTMFTSSNEDAYMRSLRKSTAHAFSKNEVGRMNDVATKYVKQFVEGRLKAFAETDQSFDPAQELNYITFQVICEAAFEYQVSKEEFEAFGHHAEIASKEFIGKSPLNPLRVLFGSFLPEVRRARASCHQLLEFAGVVLEAYRKNPNKSKQNTLIKILNENTSIADDFQRKSEIKDWLSAGHETTGYSLANALTLLAINTSAQCALQEAFQKCPNDAKLEDCDYFKYVLKESMRVMPVAAGGSGRITGREFKLDNKCNSKILPKGAICFFNQYLMNRNPAVYDDADAFLPERWADPTEEMKGAMAPFALGSRACPGQSLAMSEINSVLPSLLTKYSFEVVEEGTKTYFLTLKYQGTLLRAKKL